MLHKTFSSAIVWAAVILSAPVRADIVHFNNGESIEGKVLRESPDELILKLEDGTVTLEKSSIRRVEVITPLPEERRIPEGVAAFSDFGTKVPPLASEAFKLLKDAWEARDKAHIAHHAKDGISQKEAARLKVEIETKQAERSLLRAESSFHTPEVEEKKRAISAINHELSFLAAQMFDSAHPAKRRDRKRQLFHYIHLYGERYVRLKEYLERHPRLLRKKSARSKYRRFYAELRKMVIKLENDFSTDSVPLRKGESVNYLVQTLVNGEFNVEMSPGIYSVLNSSIHDVPSRINLKLARRLGIRGNSGVLQSITVGKFRTGNVGVSVVESPGYSNKPYGVLSGTFYDGIAHAVIKDGRLNMWKLK